MVGDVKVKGTVLDWSVKYLNLQAVGSDRLGSEFDGVGPVFIVLYTRIYLISILIDDLCKCEEYLEQRIGVCLIQNRTKHFQA